MLENAPLKTSATVPDIHPVTRKAQLADVSEMYRIIKHYADSQLMLPKTQLQLYENLRDYTVAVDADNPSSVLGCGALHIYWENLAEVRAVAVAPDMRRRGIGALIVNRLLEEAKEFKISQVFCFTYEPLFFSTFGFIQVEHSAMPLKVYNECFHCPKFNKCDELAMVIHI